MQQHLMFDVLVVSQIVFLVIVFINSKGHALDALGAYALVMGCVWFVASPIIAVANDQQNVYDWLPVLAVVFAGANFLSAAIVKYVLDNFSRA